MTAEVFATTLTPALLVVVLISDTVDSLFALRQGDTLGGGVSSLRAAEVVEEGVEGTDESAMIWVG